MQLFKFSPVILFNKDFFLIKHTMYMRKMLCMLLCMVVLAGQLWAQSRTITGKVVDDQGKPLSNVTVRAIGSNIGSSTDDNGNFTLSVPTSARDLEFTSIGFATKSVLIPSSGTVEVRMEKGTSTLSEVVVTGYSSRKKAEFTGAVAKVVAEEINQVPLASFEQILQGRAPGLYIASGSGLPGSSARVNIRGVGSIFGGNDPLYVMDGIPIEAGVFRSLNPNDFESVDVLKDAAGTSLYGSRGANGVIVITTKKGKGGKTQLNYRNMFGFAEPPQLKNIKMMNTTERLRYESEILGPGLFPAPTGLTGLPGWDYSPNNPRYAGLSDAQKELNARLLDSISRINTNWPDQFTQRAPFQQHELSASGGNQNLNFYTSLSYFDQEGIILNSGLERYTFRANIDFKSDRLSVSVRSTAGWSKQNGIESEAGVALANPIAASYLELPYRRLRNDAGNVITGAGRVGSNAYDRIFTTTNVNNQFKGNLGITINYNIWNGISFRTINGVDWRNTNTSRFIDPTSFAGTTFTGAGSGNAGAGFPTSGVYGEGNAENLGLISTTGLVYSKSIGEKHTVNASAMFEMIRNKFRNMGITTFGLNPSLPNTFAGASQGTATNNYIPTFSGGKTLNGLFSTFATVDYTYDGKYTFSGSIRRDAPSQVPETNRNNIFYSFGASWNIMREKFMDKQNFFQDAVLRASYGESGNANGFTSNFGYIATYGQLGAGYAGAPAIIPTSPGNLDYKLESQVISNVGLDLSFLDRRINTTFEYYIKDTRNLFVDQSLSRTTGFNALSTNAAKMRNQGFEFSVNADVIRRNDFRLSLGVNGATLKNEILDLGQVSEIPLGTGIIREGLPLGTHFIVGYAGVDPQTGNPIYTDVNGNPTPVYSAANNRADFGTYLPSFTGGANMDINFKGFDFSIFFSTAQGVKRFNNESFFYETTTSNIGFNKRVEMLTETWTDARTITDYQRIGSPREFSSKDIRDASFVRLRNMQIGYTLDSKRIKGIPVRSFRFWAQGQNLYTWTKWQGFDPEESNNIATYEFPNPRTITVGLDINF